MVKKDKKQRVGIVGCGNVSLRHLEAIKALPGFFRSVAFCDIKKINSEEKYFSNFEEMLLKMKNKMDLVVIATPNSLHSSQAKKALEAGYNVLIEKPVAFTENEALSIVNTSQKTHKNAYVVLQVRHNKVIKVIQSAIESNLLGEIRSVSLIQRWQRPSDFFNSWRGSLETTGGILYEMSIHYLDILQWIFGIPDVLSASGFNLKYKQLPYYDTIFSLLRFPGGASGNIEVTVAAEPHNLECSISVLGEKGAIKISGPILNKIEYTYFTNIDKKTELFLNFVKEVENSQLAETGEPSPYHIEVYRDIFKRKGIQAKEAINSIKLIESINRKSRQ